MYNFDFIDYIKYNPNRKSLSVFLKAGSDGIIVGEKFDLDFNALFQELDNFLGSTNSCCINLNNLVNKYCVDDEDEIEKEHVFLKHTGESDE